jgi:hypothetical protein
MISCGEVPGVPLLYISCSLGCPLDLVLGCLLIYVVHMYLFMSLTLSLCITQYQYFIHCSSLANASPWPDVVTRGT